MGVYLYGVRLSSPVHVTMPNGQSMQAYRYEWIGLARDLDPTLRFSESARSAARRLNAKVRGIEQAWDNAQCHPEFAVGTDGDGKPYHGAPLHRFTGTSRNVVWCDGGSEPLEYVGTLVPNPNGRGWKAVPMTKEEQREVLKRTKYPASS